MCPETGAPSTLGLSRHPEGQLSPQKETSGAVVQRPLGPCAAHNKGQRGWPQGWGDPKSAYPKAAGKQAFCVPHSLPPKTPDSRKWRFPTWADNKWQLSAARPHPPSVPAGWVGVEWGARAGAPVSLGVAGVGAQRPGWC